MKTDLKVGDSYSTVMNYRHPLLQRMSPYFQCLHGLKDPAAKRKTRWTPQATGLAAVLMALDTGCTLSVRCQDALACMGYDFKRSRRTGKTYNGLLKALQRQASAVLPILKADLRRQALLARVPKVQGWRLLAADGSKEELPRTRDMEEPFGTADNGKSPQALITAIVEVFTGLPWDWRIDKGRGSEKHHLVEMIDTLPQDSLLLADGNFVGYPIWSALSRAGQHFLIRVGGNVSLLRKLWPQTRIEQRRDIVYVWPIKNQKQHPPLRLRLIKVKGGKDPVYLLTDVLDRRKLSEAAAGKIYRLRWGVELFYRTLKRTLGYAKLRSRSAQRARLELEWGMITLWIVAMLGIERLKVKVCRLSPATVLRALRIALLRGGLPHALRDLDRALSRAYRDNYIRHAPKRSRHRPVTRTTPSLQNHKPPKIRNANAKERQLCIQSQSQNTP